MQQIGRRGWQAGEVVELVVVVRGQKLGQGKRIGEGFIEEVNIRQIEEFMQIEKC